MTSLTLRTFLAVVEIRTKLVSVSTLSLATLYVVWRRGFPDVPLFFLLWAASLAVDMGTTAFNNYFDYWRGTDRYREIDEPDKVLIHQGVDPGFAFWSGCWCFGVAIVLGSAIALRGAWWVVPAGGLGMAIGFLYTGGPYPLSRTPFGELFAGGCLGLGLFAIACGVWSVPLDAGVLAAGLPSFLWVASILTVNNTCDIAGDREAGRKTFSILVGVRGGEWTTVALGAVGQGAGIAAASAGFLPRAVLYTMLAGLAAVAPVWVALHRAGYSHATKGGNMQKILTAFLIFTLSMAGGLVLELFL